jgi:exopolysaccharide biosynthesis protein
MKPLLLIFKILITWLLSIHVLFAQVKLAWQERTEMYQNLPNSIQIFEYQGNLPITNRKVHIIFAKIDLKDKSLEIKSIASQGGKGLEVVPEIAQKHQAILAINGGYFSFKPDTTQGGLSSVSLIVSEGKTIATNQLAVLRKDANHYTHTCYPTRSAFGLKKRKPDIAWVYTEKGKNYFYQKPNPITDDFQQTPPTKKLPSKRKKWKVTEAMGGGPVLVENYQKHITDKEELFSQIAGINPRTAVGYTDKQELIFLVVDGRQEISEGVTFEELAEIFIGLGVKEAINLDGGGSSTFWVSGKVMNSPSDKTGLRKVGSILLVKMKK